tara:strand:+ start:1117 stop:1446 length:330 start_codon:yes stop_codon:yes gene_type:complete
MKNIKYLILSFIFFVLLSSCGVIKDGFSLQKKDNTDEFLVEKKNPLKLPPNFDELPVPKSVENMDKEKKEQEIKILLTNSENNSEDEENNAGSTNKNLQELLLDKIKKN